MPLVNNLEKYFDLLEKNEYLPDQKNQLKDSIEHSIHNCTDNEELLKAKEFMIQCRDDTKKHRDEYIDASFYGIGSLAMKGLAIGAGIGLFANNIGAGAIAGSLVGIEIGGLKCHYLRYQIKSAAKALETLIDLQINRINQKPSLSCK